MIRASNSPPAPAAQTSSALAATNSPRTAAEVLPEQLADLLGPALGPRPACAGLAPQHDEWVIGEAPADREARLYRALRACATCPALAPCAEALADLGDDVSGVWAGRLLSTTSRPPRT